MQMKMNVQKITKNSDKVTRQSFRDN